MARIKGMFTESEVLEILDIKKEHLQALRKDKGFPSHALGRKTRFYFDDEIALFVKSLSGTTSED